MLLRRLPAATAVGVERVALKKAAVAPPSATAHAAPTALRGEARLALSGAGVPAQVRPRTAKTNLHNSNVHRQASLSLSLSTVGAESTPLSSARGSR